MKKKVVLADERGNVMEQKVSSEVFESESPETNVLENRVRIEADALESLKGKCILRDNGLILGKDVFFFNDGSELRDVLGSLVMDYDYYTCYGASDEIFDYVSIEKTKMRKITEEDFSQAKTICERMREAIDIVADREVFRGSMMRLFDKNDNPFLLDIYCMNDALRYAITDCKGSDDEIYEWFAGTSISGSTWMNVLTFEQMLSLTGYYFDKSYHKTRKDLKCDRTGNK